MDNGASSYRRFLDGDESAFNEIMESLFRSLAFFIAVLMTVILSLMLQISGKAE